MAYRSIENLGLTIPIDAVIARNASPSKIHSTSMKWKAYYVIARDFNSPTSERGGSTPMMAARIAFQRPNIPGNAD